MQFKEEPRTKYKNNILYGVIFQARFPQIIKISNEDPAKFQDIIRKSGFPETNIKTPEPIPGISQSALKNLGVSVDTEYLFLSEDENWKVVLVKDFIALSCNDYTNYEDFEEKLKTVLDIFYKEYEPAYFNRVGLRYQNLVNSQVLQDCKDIKGFIPDHIAPEFKEDVGDEVQAFDKSIQFKDAECTSNVRYLMGKMSGLYGKYNLNGEESYVIDIDCFTNQKMQEVNRVIETSKSFNQRYVRPIFRWSITNELYSAMDPIPGSN